MEFELEPTLAMLERTPRVLSAWLAGLPAAWTHCNEGEGTWSAFDIVGHLIHGERTDWIPRLRIILEHGAARAFEPFDRFAQFEESRDKTLDELLQSFAELRTANLAQLRALNIQPEQYSLPGLHPALGPVTLGQLLANWAAHDLSHIYQIARVMARQYRDAIGPWTAYIRVMQD